MLIEAEIRLRNARIRQRRMELGLTQKQLAAKACVGICTISCIETLRSRGTDEQLARIARVLGVDADEILVEWPKALRTVEVTTAEIPPEALEAYTSIARQRALEMANVDLSTVEQTKEGLARAMGFLTYRERAIIRMRYGMDGYTHTLEEVGRKFKITKERVRAIESRAIRKLQRPSRCKLIMESLDGCSIPVLD